MYSAVSSPHSFDQPPHRAKPLVDESTSGTSSQFRITSVALSVGLFRAKYVDVVPDNADRTRKKPSSVIRSGGQCLSISMRPNGWSSVNQAFCPKVQHH